MEKIIPAETYVRVVNLPYNDHVLAKRIVAQAMAGCHIGKGTQTKLKINKDRFTTSKRRILNGLFLYSAQQLPGYCPADQIHIKVSGESVLIHYIQNQRYYKGIEEL